MDIFTVAFIGHREIDDLYKVETKLEVLIKELLLSHEYVEFLVLKESSPIREPLNEKCPLLAGTTI